MQDQQDQQDQQGQQQQQDTRAVAEEIAQILEKTGVIARLKAFATTRFGGCFSSSASYK
jgi:hypothetical protein